MIFVRKIVCYVENCPNVLLVENDQKLKEYPKNKKKCVSGYKVCVLGSSLRAMQPEIAHSASNNTNITEISSNNQHVVMTNIKPELY